MATTLNRDEAKPTICSSADCSGCGGIQALLPADIAQQEEEKVPDLGAGLSQSEAGLAEVGHLDGEGGWVNGRRLDREVAAPTRDGLTSQGRARGVFSSSLEWIRFHADSLRRKSFNFIFAEALNLLAHTGEKGYLSFIWLLERYVSTPQQKVTVEWLRLYCSPGHPGAAYFNRVLRSLSPNVRRRFVAGFVGNLLFRGTANIVEQEKTQQEIGCSPKLAVISPTDACNYRCIGCYANAYGLSNRLEPGLVQRVIDECKALGVRFFVISGGEPFVYKPLLNIFAANLDSTFIVYTNGSLIDKKMARRLEELGNVCPCVSVEGFEEQTDWRRGKGAWQAAVRAWENMREVGMVYGFSATATTRNYKVITSEEFAQTLIDYNVHFGWYFIYIPTGANPDMSLFLSAKQRSHFRERLAHVRRTMPILAGDFWNDGTLTDGCLAGGRHYFHVNARGDVEPCVFAHFTADNIRDKSVKEVLASPFMRYIRENAAHNWNDNRLTPCCIIDHPTVLRTAALEHGGRPSHEGADVLFTELGDYLEQYGRELEEITRPVWETRVKPWVERFQGWVDNEGRTIKEYPNTRPWDGQRVDSKWLERKARKEAREKETVRVVR